MQSLESHACQKICGGLLRNPKKVFLFGNNTLAGKERDSTSPEEYAELLRKKDPIVYKVKAFSEEEAAFRYSLVGARAKGRVRGLFPNANIYGFHSIAPQGLIMRRQKAYTLSAGFYFTMFLLI